jgi:hypothetical protein
MEEKLLQVMTFSKPRGMLRRKGERGIELLRFCNLPGITVVGGASKLFSWFIKNYNPERVFSFCDISRSSDPEKTVYVKMGFELESQSPPNYWYVIHGKREHRMNFVKSKLIAQGFDPSKTEAEIMNERGFSRIFDCGSFKFKWERFSV